MNANRNEGPAVKRHPRKILRDTSRVITRPHMPDSARVLRVAERVLKLDEAAAGSLLRRVLRDFSRRHRDIEGILLRQFNAVAALLPDEARTSRVQRLLIGAFFTMEYAIESAALFNPSIVAHPDQSGLKDGELRFIMSLRATGEGHISSIVFRCGIIDRNNDVEYFTAGTFVDTPQIELDLRYNRHLFQLKLLEINSSSPTTDRILVDLRDEFTFVELDQRIELLRGDASVTLDEAGIQNVYWLAKCNYQIRFPSEHDASERVIFPYSATESSGIEDARFVRFRDDNGEIMYYATYTAFNGVNILSQLIETKDFLSFKMMTLNGPGVQNKGLALFPRKVGGKYAMLSRRDGENNYVMFSDHIRFWHDARLIQEPAQPWEFMQIGNCGSPLEVAEGWLVLTHGVGPMRQYSIGAILLDLEDPTRVIARLKEPLMTPHEEEREGYVPNVVYSCGSLIHNNEIILPYAMSDVTSAIATVNVQELLDSMESV